MTTTYRIGQMVWDGGDEYGANRTGGMVVSVGADDEGETVVTVITTGYDNARLKRPSLIVHHHDGRTGTKRPAYEDIGVVARLVRMPVTSIDPYAADDFRSYAKVLEHARAALFAASVCWLPDYRDDRAHDAFLTVYRELRAESDLLRRGVA